MEISTSATPAPEPSPYVPQRPLVAQPAFQPSVLYVAEATGKVTVEEGAVVSTSQVLVAGVASVLPTASVARTSKVWLPSLRVV